VLLFYDWCSSVSSLTGSFRRSGHCHRGLGTGGGGFECLSGDTSSLTRLLIQNRGTSSCLCDGFWQAGVHVLLFCSSSSTHVCVSVEGRKRLSQKGVLSPLSQPGCFSPGKMWPAAERYEDRQLNKWFMCRSARRNNS